MKRNVLVLTAVSVLALLIAVSCAPEAESGPKGSITAEIAAERSLSAPVGNIEWRWKLRMGERAKDGIITGSRAVWTDLDAGTYVMEVEGYIEGDRFGQARKEVVLKPGERARCSLRVEREDSRVSVSFKGVDPKLDMDPDAKRFSFTLSTPDGKKQYQVPLRLLGNECMTGTIRLPAGSYRVDYSVKGEKRTDSINLKPADSVLVGIDASGNPAPAGAGLTELTIEASVPEIAENASGAEILMRAVRGNSNANAECEFFLQGPGILVNKAADYKGIRYMITPEDIDHAPQGSTPWSFTVSKDGWKWSIDGWTNRSGAWTLPDFRLLHDGGFMFFDDKEKLSWSMTEPNEGWSALATVNGCMSVYEAYRKETEMGQPGAWDGFYEIDVTWLRHGNRFTVPTLKVPYETRVTVIGADESVKRIKGMAPITLRCSREYEEFNYHDYEMWLESESGRKVHLKRFLSGDYGEITVNVAADPGIYTVKGGYVQDGEAPVKVTEHYRVRVQ